MNNSRPRINPRHRTIDLERLAAALLDMASHVEVDEEDLEVGAQIQASLKQPVNDSAPNEGST